MEPNRIRRIFSEVAEKMGIENRDGYQNPLRPKRMRKVFKTACAQAQIDEGYHNVFMGHKSNVSQGYLEKPIQHLEIEYSRVEPLLTIYGVSEAESLSGLRSELNLWKSRYAELAIYLEPVKALYESAVEIFGEDRAPDILREHFVANMDAMIEVYGSEEQFRKWKSKQAE